MKPLTKRHVAIAAIAMLAFGCKYYITGEGGAGGNASNTNTNPTGPSPTPSPTPTPTPTSPGGRTPDPPAGTFLPFPNYTHQAVLSVSVPIGSPCLNFTYLDAVVDALRRQDTRWGYVCASTCQDVRRDKVAYHGAAGSEVTGALGVWVVDIIQDACGPSQAPGFTVGSYDPLLSWSSRGRF